MTLDEDGAAERPHWAMALIVHEPLVQETAPPPLQQSDVDVHDVPVDWHASVFTLAHIPFVQKPEQH